MSTACPICKTVLENAPDEPTESEQLRPFCSPRCKLVDLGNWLNESYRIPTGERPEGNEDEFGPS
ncbi:MAG TPA: DNA gyrase inhibitor YacG [Polyangiaceae bacterium]